jgi:hypothetical protein
MAFSVLGVLGVKVNLGKEYPVRNCGRMVNPFRDQLPVQLRTEYPVRNCGRMVNPFRDQLPVQLRTEYPVRNCGRMVNPFRDQLPVQLSRGLAGNQGAGQVPMPSPPQDSILKILETLASNGRTLHNDMGGFFVCLIAEAAFGIKRSVDIMPEVHKEIMS